MDNDIINVNCGRCGRKLRMPLEDLLDKRTVECADCALMQDRREPDTRQPRAMSRRYPGRSW